MELQKGITKWIINKDIISHMCQERGILGEITMEESKMRIRNELGKEIKNQGNVTGNIIWIDKENNEIKITMSNVIIIPELKYNFLSEKILKQKGFILEKTENECKIQHEIGITLTAYREQENYCIYSKREDKIEKAMEINENDPETEEESLDCIMSEPEQWRDIQEMEDQEKQLWMKAMTQEMTKLVKKGIIIEEDPREGNKVIGSRWTYAVKRDETQKVKKIRARLVAQGFGQRSGIDYGETFAPVIKHTTIRALLTLAAKDGLISKHYDIASAFLYGEIEEQIYMRGPVGPFKTHSKIFRLTKAIYGLKQAAYSWNRRIDETLVNGGYKVSENDPCLYRKGKEEQSIYVLIHVDDLLIVGKCLDEINKLMNMLQKEYELKDLGEAKCYLGMNLKWQKEKRTVYLYQTPKIEQLITRYKMDEAKVSTIPMYPDYPKSQQHSTSPDLEDNREFQSLIGSLLYISIVTRPDIHVATNLLGRRVSKPTWNDWEAGKKILRYLKGTKDKAIRLGGERDLDLTTYCDADWGGDTEKRRSTSGQLHFLGDSLIEWRTRKQTCVALSTAEAEFISMAQATQEVMWIQRMVRDLDIPGKSPSVVYTDSQSGIHMAQSRRITSRSKHIEVKYMFVKDIIEKKQIVLMYCPTENMIADILTKPLGRLLLNKFVQMMGLIENHND